MDPGLPILPLTGGHLGCFQFGAIMNKAAVTYCMNSSGKLLSALGAPNGKEIPKKKEYIERDRYIYTHTRTHTRGLPEWLRHTHVRIHVGFPSGSVVKNLPANAGDLVSVPGPQEKVTARSSILA